MKRGYESIVVGVDGSAGARDALHAAGDLAEAFGSVVHVVSGTVRISPSDYRTALALLHGDPGYEPPDDEPPAALLQSNELFADANEVLDAAPADLNERGVAAERHLCVDHAADALIGVAERVDADLVVVGSRGLGTARRAFLGSVSSKIAHHAPCAVLIVGHRQT